jgi:peptidoglycan/xylan/chitin deacetylase (PgdA/CDA1 family)
MTTGRRILRRALVRTFALAGTGESGLRILTYHRVNDGHPHDRLSVTSRAFTDQMDALASSGRPVLPLAHALPALAGAAPLPAGAVALTFDDGFEDNYSTALPILHRFGFTATFFIVTGAIGGTETLDRYRGCCAADRMLDWEQVLSLRARGHTIGGHGRTHRELTRVTAAELREEAEGCRRDIDERTGESPRLFCYPRGQESVGVRQVVAAAGFEAACTVRPGVNPPGTEPFVLRRTEISGDDTSEDFRLKLEGGFDTWHRFWQRAQAAWAP